MTNSHLVLILRTLSKKEERELRKWLNSPAHNHREDVVTLFEYLMAGQHLYEEKFLEKERVFSRIFSNEPYDDAKLRQSMHFLLKSVEEFLIYQEQQSDEVRARMALASVFRKRKLDRAFTKAIKAVEVQQEKANYRNEQYLRNEYLLQLEKYSFYDGKKRTTEMNLQEVSDALDLTFVADKLRQGCLMIAHQSVYKAQYNIGLLEYIIEYVDRQKLMLHHPAIAVYFYGYKAITDESGKQYFENLRQEIQKHRTSFPKSELRDIYLMAVNYCIRQANKFNDSELIREAFRLYRQGLENEILLENGVVSPFTFRNAVGAALRLKEYDWVEHFIHQYKKALPPDYRESFFLHSLARLNFEKGDYGSAMQLLAQTDFDDTLINLNAKSMLLKIYYELDEYDALESLLESMRAYLKRKQLMGAYRSNYHNFIRFTRKLVRVNPFDEQEKSALKSEILTASPLTEKDWLLEQVTAL
jgi:hypothetical protein